MGARADVELPTTPAGASGSAHKKSFRRDRPCGSSEDERDRGGVGDGRMSAQSALCAQASPRHLWGLRIQTEDSRPPCPRGCGCRRAEQGRRWQRAGEAGVCVGQGWARVVGSAQLWVEQGKAPVCPEAPPVSGAQRRPCPLRRAAATAFPASPILG